MGNIGKIALHIVENMDIIEDLRELRRRVIEEEKRQYSDPTFQGLYSGILRELGYELNELDNLK